MRLRLLALVPLAALAFTIDRPASPDDLDAFVMKQMEQRNIAGLSLAVVQDGRIVTARAYGLTDRGSARRVDTTTLFEAGAFGRIKKLGREKVDPTTDARFRVLA